MNEKTEDSDNEFAYELPDDFEFLPLSSLLILDIFVISFSSNLKRL